MADPKKKKLSFPEKIRKLKAAGIEPNSLISSEADSLLPIADLQLRVKEIMGIVNSSTRKSTDMLFFVMYDIEDDKVRYQVHKYLLRMGCSRIQRSIFLADLPPNKYNEIRDNLTEVQELYDNHDSILIVPISTDYLQAMKIIGKSIDVDIIMRNKNTLFF